MRWPQTQAYGVPQTVLALASIGALVPHGPPALHVHSTFARACNFVSADTLLSLVGPEAGCGPASCVLAAPAPCDLRGLFEIGEALSWRDGALRARRASVTFEQAVVWHPLPRRALLPPLQIEANLAVAARRLAQRRSSQPNVLDGAAAGVVDALASATRNLDHAEATRRAGQLVGWGEGLTPAGDDFLVGWLAGLERLAHDAQHSEFYGSAAAALHTLAARTTPIAAQFLRFAAKRQHGEVVDTLLDALLCEHRGDLMNRALDHALAVGATSGADLVSGARVALAAWLPGAHVS